MHARPWALLCWLLPFFKKRPQPLHLALRLYNPPKEPSFNPQYISKASGIQMDRSCCWLAFVSGGQGDWFLNCRRWELDIEGYP